MAVLRDRPYMGGARTVTIQLHPGVHCRILTR